MADNFDAPWAEPDADAPAGVDDLAARCRALWRRGDWHSLAAYSVNDVEHHPQRASLALMIAAGHQALGQAGQTRLLVDQARKWGCKPELIARTLISGVHNTLGRALAASGKQLNRARQHFADAIGLHNSSISGELILQDRVRQQLASMHLQPDLPQLLKGTRDSAMEPLQGPAQAQIDALRRSSELALIRLKEQSQQLASVRRAIEAAVRKETANAVNQLEAFAKLQRYLSEGQLMPELHGWPVSPDLAILLVDMVESNDYDLVIEFGSGTSTLLMAIALARTARRRPHCPAAVQVAFEHLEAFHRQTLSRLLRAGVADAVQLELAQLQPWTSAQGKEYAFYACQEQLDTIARALPDTPARALVLVDGPPAATGEHARYPALPIVLASLPGMALDVLLDDHARPEEQEISKMWLAELEAAGRRASASTLALEKGACLIRIEA